MSTVGRRPNEFNIIIVCGLVVCPTSFDQDYGIRKKQKYLLLNFSIILSYFFLKLANKNFLKRNKLKVIKILMSVL